MPSSRIQRESQTVAAMLRLYCRDHHAVDPRKGCPECRELLDYARQRLERCRFQDGKTVCARCPVHCYTPQMRERVREVMRYAGPRMIGRHPVLTLAHLWDKRRKAPLPRKKG